MTTSSIVAPIKGADVVLRPIEDADQRFLFELYASTRATEMAMVNWDMEQKHHFLAMQFRAQHAHYMEHFPDATFDVMEWRGTQIGRLYVEEWPSQIRIIDIAILPQYQGQGVGSYFLKRLMHRARKAAKAVSIHVEQTNPAMKLYTRLGFVKIEDQGVYDLMAWEPK